MNIIWHINVKRSCFTSALFCEMKFHFWHQSCHKRAFRCPINVLEKKIICSLSPLFSDTACSHPGIKYIKLLFLSSAANLSKVSYTVACFVQHAPWNDRKLSARSQRKVGCWVDLRARRNEVMMPRTQPAIEVNRLSQTTHPWMHMEAYT